MKACFLATIILPSSFDCKALTYLKLLECRAQSNDKSSRTLNLGTPHHLSFIHIDTFTFTLALSITWYLYHKPPHTLTLNLTHSSSRSPCLAHTNILRHGFTRAHTTERERYSHTPLVHRKRISFSIRSYRCESSNWCVWNYISGISWTDDSLRTTRRFFFAVHIRTHFNFYKKVFSKFGI